jgi:hypothetical protein
MTITKRILAFGLIAGAVAGTSTPAVASSGKALTGTLKFSPGKLARVHGRLEGTGTYFRMLLPGQTDKYFLNPDARASDKSYPLLRPGTNGGLKLGNFQQPPSSPFSSTGNARANRITQPEKFASILFSISTAPKDAQTGAPVKAPSLTLRGTKLTGNFTAWTAEWNKIYFNQGAPKPNGSYPALTRAVTGTYNSRTHAYVITWYSAIVGGPFNGFTGFWHLQGKLAK